MEKDNFKPLVTFDSESPKEPEDSGVKDIQDLVGLFKYQTSVPTGIPRKFSEQVRIVVTGGASSLYIYDPANALWRSATLIST